MRDFSSFSNTRQTSEQLDDEHAIFAEQLTINANLAALSQIISQCNADVFTAPVSGKLLPSGPVDCVPHLLIQKIILCNVN